jgi:broad specificity phosphatase PhoE
LIDPAKINHFFVSPRKRAKTTFDLLFGGDFATANADKITVTEDIAEWDYGDYEGLLIAEIKKRRKEKGLDKEEAFDMWRDGCEGGEYAISFEFWSYRVVLMVNSGLQGR